MRIRISWPAGELTAELEDTPSTKALAQRLPVESSAATWGDEVYFDVGLDLELESDASQVVDAGAVCFWPPGHAVALPFGPTPVSKGDECRLASAANVMGQIEGDHKQLSTVSAGDPIRIEALD